MCVCAGVGWGGHAMATPLFTRLSLPEGLEEVVEGLAREVIKSQYSQPYDIYNFAWKYFSDLVARRKSLPAKSKSSSFCFNPLPFSPHAFVDRKGCCGSAYLCKLFFKSYTTDRRLPSTTNKSQG